MKIKDTNQSKNDIIYFLHSLNVLGLLLLL